MFSVRNRHTRVQNQEICMTRQFKFRQRGVSFLGILLIGSLLACLGVMAVQVVPMVVEYQAVVKAVKQASRGSTVAEVRKIFDKVAVIDNIHPIVGKDLEVIKEGDKTVVTFAYQREIHLVGPAYLTLKYQGQVN
ncbi:MAG: hypothetical protein ACI9I0_000285 [Rhodoferax sp.]|jgi:hypothetical protein